MRMPLPYFLLQRLGRVRPPRRSAASLSSDPANMGTEFALEASLAGWSDSLLRAGRDGEAPAPAAHDEPPLRWLARPPQRGGG